VLTPGVSRSDVGLVWPGHGGAVATGFALGVCAVFVSQGLALRRRVARGAELPDRASMAPLLPFTTGERWVAGLVAVTAGVCEEVVFRGVLPATGVAVFGLTPLVAMALSLVAFGLAHAYRGLPGIAAALLLGLVFAALYAMTGSLLIAIAVHALIDINALLIVPTARPSTDSRAAAPATEPGPVPA
jgi:membrane protease YdiL (CAAX protease family)